jgi:hypothetical protein
MRPKLYEADATVCLDVMRVLLICHDIFVRRCQSNRAISTTGLLPITIAATKYLVHCSSLCGIKVSARNNDQHIVHVDIAFRNVATRNGYN